LPRNTASLLAAASIAGGAAAQSPNVLRVAPAQDLRILDPTWATADATQGHAYLIYDMLFALDAEGQPKPQMIESFTISPDRLVYDFTLRPGLRFHDGQPVTTRDVIASLKRWSIRAPDGRLLMARLESLEARDDRSFTIRLKLPFSMMLHSLGNPVATIPIILRESDASIAPQDQIRNSVGSGPFVFQPEKWMQGSRWSYRRNDAYVPRAEPPSGMAGGKVPRVAEIDFIYLPDPTTAANALARGEIDVLQQVPYDLIPVLERRSEITLKVIDPGGFQVLFRPNSLWPPFNNVKSRQALMALVDPREMLTAMVGDFRYARECLSAFMCMPGNPEPLDVKIPDIARAKRLMGEAGYAGEKVIILSPTDLPELHRVATVLAERLREIGVSAEQQDMDFGTLATLRTNMDDPAKSRSGWSIFPTWRAGLTAQNPIINSGISTSCDRKNWFGWPCDEEIERLRTAWLDARSPQEAQAIMRDINARFAEVVPYATVGQFFRPIAYRQEVKGILDAPVLLLWNVEKTR